MKRFCLPAFVLLIMLFSAPIVRSEEPCLTSEDPGCLETWVIGANMLVTFEVPGISPPCTVTTRVWYSKKCDIVIVHDIDYSFTYDPTSCLYNTGNTYTVNVWAGVRDALLKALAIVKRGGNPNLYNCPNGYITYDYRSAPCWRLVTIYYVNNPVGGGLSGPYQLPWGAESLEQHMLNLQALGANMSNLAATLEACTYSNCCAREIFVCFQNGVPVVTYGTFSAPIEECPNSSDISCRINVCGDLGL